jgi:hypothetical protein
MGQSILFAFFGFLLGVLATLLVQRLWSHFRRNDPKRQQTLEHLHTLQMWMESYDRLFDAVYPECPELILAHKMLSHDYPHYDKNAPVRLCEALREYRDLQAKHEALNQQAAASLRALAEPRLDRLYNLNKSVTAFARKMHVAGTKLLFPVSFPTEIAYHLQVIDQYRGKVFEEFPRRAVEGINWEKVNCTDPEDLATIIQPHLAYFQKDEDISRDREKESRLFDEMQNLSFYRIVAKKEIGHILAKIHQREAHYN